MGTGEEKPMTDVRASMKRSQLFAELSTESTEHIIQKLRRIKYKQDSVICREGDMGDRLFIIEDGEVTICKDMAWGQREVQRMSAGEVFGEMALISKARRSATVKAVTDTVCLLLDDDDFAMLLEEDSHFAQRVAQILTMRLADLGERSSDDLVHAYRALMFSLAGLAETRDPDTGAHLERTRNYCALLSDILAKHPNYEKVVTPAFIDGIYMVSPLHDIGKVAIPDSILLKPARLTPEEFDTMKTHTTVGAQALKNVLDESDQEIFQMGFKICMYHHEKWDGTGYPIGLSGEDIPAESRIMMLADIFDALLSKRVYKPAMDMNAVCEEIEKSSGTFFDPVITDTFLSHVGLFETIYLKYKD